MDTGVNGGTAEHEHEYARHRPTKPRRGHAVFRTRPNIRLQVTPLARPVTRGVVHAGSVPSVVAFTHVASGAPEAWRWAAEEGHASFSRWREPESAANAIHARTKTPVRTIRNTQRRQSFYT